jgi:cystathionine beta-lyase/cystathionine gamma-synthase
MEYLMPIVQQDHRKQTTALKRIIKYMPQDWLMLTTHRLDIYDESRAKLQFIEELLKLVENDNINQESLAQLPPAFDYVRLGHQLSSVYEWGVAQRHGLSADKVISFASQVMPLLAILRTNTARKRRTVIYHDCELPSALLSPLIQDVYGYNFESQEIKDGTDVPESKDATHVYITERPLQNEFAVGHSHCTVHLHPLYGSTLLINEQDEQESLDWISKIQHVRRRETIAVTPPYSLRMIKEFLGEKPQPLEVITDEDWKHIEVALLENTGAAIRPLIATSGLSVQYGILMGLLHQARLHHPGKPIKLIIPPNCYGGTNDQARRCSAMAEDVTVVDLPVDAGKEMTDSLEEVLKEVALEDAVAIILVEIPTNPRVEVPDMALLGEVLTNAHKTKTGTDAISPIFIVDQTFCPNVRLLHDQSSLVNVQTLSFSSGSKFPSGGHCTSGYVTANKKAEPLLSFIETHLQLCDNLATPLQLQILSQSMPSMKQRIEQAFVHTQKFVQHIKETWPRTKISFIREDLIEQGFTPSVFSFDLPEKGDTAQERDQYKKELNFRLIAHIIEQLPDDAKHCVSYGQLRRSYWTVPATSTQGTTKEDDKDYVVRVALPPDIDIDRLIEVFDAFCHKEGI